MLSTLQARQEYTDHADLTDDTGPSNPVPPYIHATALMPLLEISENPRNQSNPCHNPPPYQHQKP
jgi:hypothetical protein